MTHSCHEVNRITLAAVVTSGSGRQLAKGGVQCALRCLNKGRYLENQDLQTFFLEDEGYSTSKKNVLESHVPIFSNFGHGGNMDLIGFD